jgi:hypothetical protein
MIAYDLECTQGHVFEGWFDSLESFEDQKANELISCPYCEDTKVKKILSPVAVKKALPSPQARLDNIDYQKLAKEIVDYVNHNFDDVGTKFTTEALKMHYGVTEKRNIRGAATEEEEKVLADEGVEFFKMPLPNMDDDKKN